MMDFIERLRAKPDYIRRRIALGAASGVTAVVALVWGVAMASSGVLALNAPAKASTQIAATVTDHATNAASVFSAAAALAGAKNESDITVVDTKASSTLDAKASDERTVIPF